MRQRLRQIQNWPVCDLPVLDRATIYDDSVLASDGVTYKTRDLRKEAHYRFDYVDSGTREGQIKIRNIGIGINRRLKRLGNPPAGLVSCVEFDSGDKMPSTVKLYVKNTS
ncbi:MAG: hypothetical protein EPN88_17530 [Bacteroidetes bacterium]|nr:MAG: hypothetical protein EPN88_17530 [Bacteroidota bacterium]